MIGRKRILTIETLLSDRAGVTVFEHKIHGFKRNLDKETAELFAKFFDLLARPGERVLISFYPLFQEDWISLAAFDWTTLKSTAEERRGKHIDRLGWVLGYAHTVEKLAEVYRFGWNNNLNDTLLVVIAPINDDGSVLLSKHADIGPGDELVATDYYHTVIGCYFDAQWMTVASKIYSAGEIVERILKAAPKGYSLSVKTSNGN
jgi:hypothetical protein